MSHGALQKTFNTCGPLLFNKIPGFGLGLCSWPLLGLYTCPRRTASVAPKGQRGPRLRNPDLETRAADVWDLVQSDQKKLATLKTGQLSRLVC